MTDQSTKERMLDKIQALLEKTIEQGATAPEEESAKRMAAKLMAKYNIEMADIDSNGKDATPDGLQVDGQYYSTVYQGRNLDWEYRLAKAIARGFDTRVIFTYSRGVVLGVRFIGMKSDLEVVIHLFKYLRIEIGFRAEREYRTQQDQNDYGLGASHRIKERVEEMYSMRNYELEKAGKYDLIVVKDDAIKEYINTNISFGKSVNLNSTKSGAAFSRGYADAGSMNLDSGRSKVNA